MTVARSRLIHPETTPYYHCVARCVRRAFLCGYDKYVHRSYEHRKPWVVDRLRFLASLFSIDVCAYAVMSNHYHVILRVDLEGNKRLSDEAVIERWGKLFTIHVLVARWQSGQTKSEAEVAAARELVNIWRERLADISWFMRCLNEHIAREANKEDKCKGRFWEGRFRSQALMDETALLACMVYVDLNPIRAGLCDSVEEEEFTSIHERIGDWKAASDKQCGGQGAERSNFLLPFARTKSETDREVPFDFKEYLYLTDWTGRAMRDDKRGYIPEETPKLLENLLVPHESWVMTVQHFSRSFGSAAGTWEAITALSHKVGHHWIKGHSACDRLYKSG